MPQGDVEPSIDVLFKLETALQTPRSVLDEHLRNIQENTAPITHTPYLDEYHMPAMNLPKIILEP
jgi:hypothetical protein